MDFENTPSTFYIVQCKIINFSTALICVCINKQLFQNFHLYLYIYISITDHEIDSSIY